MRALWLMCCSAAAALCLVAVSMLPVWAASCQLPGSVAHSEGIEITPARARHPPCSKRQADAGGSSAGGHYSGGGLMWQVCIVQCPLAAQPWSLWPASTPVLCWLLSAGHFPLHCFTAFASSSGCPPAADYPLPR